MATIQETGELTGSRISQYSIVDLIGSGGMGEVYLAHDERLCRDVAIKVLGPRHRSDPQQRGLMMEARLLSRFNNPHVAGIYELINRTGADFLVMEFVPGATLKQVLEGGPLPPTEVVRLGMQLTAGLAAVHGARVIHRDIKPANLKVTSSGDLKILDFGLAKVLPSAASVDLSTTTVPVEGVAGTLPYMAPEQLRGEPVDERCDIYSAGAVLYEMMTGKRAFPQEQVACLIDAVLNEEPVDPCALSPFIPRALARVVLRAMRKRPHDRFQRAEQLSRALEDLSCAAVSRPVRRFADWLATLLG